MSRNRVSVSGIGTLSELVPDSLDESVNDDINVVSGKSVGSRGVLETFENAQYESGTGLYQAMLLIVCGLVNMSCAISTTAVSFIIPAAKDDFNLNSTTKGILNFAPFLGMMFGAYFWGICGDIKGRRFVILGSMGMDTLFTILSCFTQQNIKLFIIIRVGNGFAIIGAICMIYVYLGEFLTPDKRDSYLLLLEIFWVLGMILNPGVAMMIIPNNIALLSHTYFSLNAWRVFILLTSVPSLISVLLIYQYPETPRHLMLSGQMTQSWDILEHIYLVNRKNTTQPYSVEKFTRTIPATWFDTGLIGISFMTNLKKRLIILKHGHKILISDYCKNITIICVIEFCIMASYVAVLVWVPELFSRYYAFKVNNSDDINICSASKWLLEHHSKSSKSMGGSVSSDAYLVALIVALSTMPLVILTGIIIKYCNKKMLLFVSCGVPILVSLLMTITKNDRQAQIMCCVFEGFTTLIEPIIFCIMVELFPSNALGVAFSITVMIGRLGGIFGIIVFGILIDKNCFMIFYILAVLLMIAFLLVAFLPKLKIGGSH